jgi:hypothetical protein
MLRSRLTAAFIAAGACAMTPRPTFADPVQTLPPAPTSISADVIVLHATNDSSGIDPAIGSMPALLKPPFSSFNSYKLLSRNSLRLPRGVAAPLKLPTGRELHVVYKEVERQGLPPARRGQRHARRMVLGRRSGVQRRRRLHRDQDRALTRRPIS